MKMCKQYKKIRKKLNVNEKNDGEIQRNMEKSLDF